MTAENTRQKRSSEDLQKASFHLRYEVAMLKGTAKLLHSGRNSNGFIHNALVESFTVHTRGLLFFLYAENPRDDDIVAEDFLPNSPTWASVRPPKTPLLTTVTDRVGKEVAHLTYARQLREKNKEWAFTEISDDILKVIDVFLSHSPDSVLCKEWTDYKHTPFRVTAVTDTMGFHVATNARN